MLRPDVVIQPESRTDDNIRPKAGRDLTELEKYYVSSLGWKSLNFLTNLLKLYSKSIKMVLS